MEHDEIAGKLSEYRDAALDAAERERVARHLAECSACAGELADWELLSRAFLRRPQAPTAFQTEAFVARVMARLPAEASPFAWLAPRWLVPALGVGFAVLAFSFRPYGSNETSDPAEVLLLSGSERAAPAEAAVSPEPLWADVLGLDADE